MIGTLLTGLAAGLASALLYASIVSGSAMAIVLFYAAPLPLMIAAMGWGPLAGAVAVAVGFSSLALLLSTVTSFVFITSVGIPAFVLSYLTMLGRRDETEAVEWFPVGSLVAVAALLAGLIGLAGVLAIGPTAEAFMVTMREGIEAIMRAQMNIPEGQPLVLPDIADPKQLVNALAGIVPPILIMFFTITSLLNLWIAGKVVQRSGRLVRPWPRLASMRMPRFAGPALIATAVASFMSGTPGLIAELFCAGLIMAFVVAGFALIHDITVGVSSRGLILSALYIACFVMGWTAVAVAGFALADQFADFRARIAARRRPMPPQQPPAS